MKKQYHYFSERTTRANLLSLILWKSLNYLKVSNYKKDINYKKVSNEQKCNDDDAKC